MQQPEQLTTSKLQSMVEGFFWVLPNIGIGLAVMAGFWIGGLAARRAVLFAFARRRRTDLGQLLGGFARWSLIFTGFLVFATIVFPSIKPSDLLATLGVGSLAVGLAFRDILQNWFSGVMILYSQPFRAGDQIVSGAHEGTVEQVEARATIIKTYDGQRVLIPNSNLYTRSIIVRTHFPTRRSEADVTIGYNEDPDAVAEAAVRALSAVDGIAKDPPPDACAWEFSEAGVTLRVRWWTDSVRNKVVTGQGRAIAAIRRALRDAGVELAFPTRIVMLQDGTGEDPRRGAEEPAPGRANGAARDGA
ncbi:mechanosensitive ion channel family protein [Pararoseomonas indoligenes]|uniref:Small-conductance mechanosensitive channel n=1 Tax=Roseomonas indoligenes TaxID=2820811 RepID=A0A940MY30_9PROT|nr:mechanosensitive ion channel family protein [Pararoseomonas indoligenes]MBP0493793.1 mechanosensitive ion channel family protein [Pararoseomonas indoligenes]